ncbi:HAD family hydrolase [Propionicicella superfundia]|uniref:HAD family hydrolase n=1 Tax=Propionicicella superfundia TaxID=348582 RepID=UPI0004265B2D|nr:HAD family hydrolase [Propionicicella superfundia]
MIRLIASDFDGTLLRSDKTVSERTHRLIRDVADAGILFVPASGRQLSNLAEPLARLGFAGTVLAANGALGIDVPDLTVRHSIEMRADAARMIIARLKEQVPSLRIAVARELSRQVVGEHGYTDLAGPADGEPPTPGLPEETIEELLALPTLKILARAPGWTIQALYELAASFEVPGVAVCDGGAPFLEIQAEGVNKGTGLARLCDALGIERSQVLAIGDWLNDLEMLEWAGSAVAVANAHPRALALADHVAPSNDEDGVASVLAAVLDGRFPGGTDS